MSESILAIRNKFHMVCTGCLDLLRASIALNEQKVQAGDYIYTDRMHFAFIDGLFVNLFTGWEHFIEDTFVSYSMGAVSANGIPTTRYIIPKDENHAYAILSGDKDYPDWTDHKKIVRLGSNSFDPSPYRVLPEFGQQLLNIKKIRNAISHASKDSQSKFDTLMRDEFGFLPVGITPSKFLLGIKNIRGRSPQTYFGYYTSCLKSIADAIT